MLSSIHPVNRQGANSPNELKSWRFCDLAVQPERLSLTTTGFVTYNRVFIPTRSRGLSCHETDVPAE